MKKASKQKENFDKDTPLFFYPATDSTNLRENIWLKNIEWWKRICFNYVTDFPHKQIQAMEKAFKMARGEPRRRICHSN